MDNARISALELLQGANGASMTLSIRGDGAAKNDKLRYLKNNIKSALSDLIDSSPVESAKIITENDAGDQLPIDLISDRIIDSRSVPMSGRYPVQFSMYLALRSSYEDYYDELKEIFGEGQDAID